MGYGQNNQNQERQAFSLLELNNRVKGVILNAFPETCWVRAEMSDVRTNAASGHCYLEFIEKNAITGQLVAKARGSIWAKTFRMLKPYFEMETGQIFASGLKVSDRKDSRPCCLPTGSGSLRIRQPLAK